MLQTALSAVFVVGLILSTDVLSRAQSSDHVVSLKQFVDNGGINDAPDTTIINKPAVKTTISLNFPRFDVYAPSGDLVYHTDDLDQIRRFLDHFPESAVHLEPIHGTAAWSSIASTYHLGDAPPPRSASQGHYTFLSLILDNCNPCSIERELLNKVSDKLSKQGVRQEILVLAR
jgi:hypothetical protein